MSLALLPTVYLSEFHRPDDPDIYNWLESPLSHAPHVIHLAAEDLVVWAPTGLPYPSRNGCPTEAPDYLKADISELGSVPEELVSRYQTMVEEPLPSISLDFLDMDSVHELMSLKGLSMQDIPIEGTEERIGANQFLAVEDMEAEREEDKEEEGKGTEDEIVENKGNSDCLHQEATNHVESSMMMSDSTVFNMGSSDNTSSSNPESTTNSITTAHHQSIDDNYVKPPSQGLDHGQFAGLSPEDVVELMRESLRAVPEDDVQGKVKTMSQYFDYFGELSARELERVDGPPKPRTRKRKQKLAIRFPDRSTSTDQPPLIPPPPTFSDSEDSIC